MTFLLIFLMLFVGTYIGLVLPYYVTKFISGYDRKKLLDILIPTPIDENRICNGPHDWIETVSVNDSGEYSPINLCGKCGFIPSKNLMATKEGLERIKQNNEIRQLEDSVHKEFCEKETSDIKKFIKDGINFDKAAEIYHAGQTSIKRYTIYKIARSEEIRRETKEEA